jgi:hypothetical protein
LPSGSTGPRVGSALMRQEPKARSPAVPKSMALLSRRH